MHAVKNHKRLSALVIVAVLALAGGAYAYWTGSGTGSGTTTVGTVGSVTIAATVPDDITPGTTKSISFTAANATASAIGVTQVHLDSVDVDPTDTTHAACETDDFTMANVSEVVGGVPHSVPANATSETLPNNGTLSYANVADTNQDACKGASLILTFSTT